MPKKVVLSNYRKWRSYFKNREHHEYGRLGKNDFFFQPYYTMLFWRRRNFAVDSNKIKQNLREKCPYQELSVPHSISTYMTYNNDNN